MESAPRPTYEDLERQLAELKTANVTLADEKMTLLASKESLLRAATETTRAILLPAHDLAQGGLWIQRRDLQAMHAIEAMARRDEPQSAAQSAFEPGQEWIWHQMSADKDPDDPVAVQEEAEASDVDVQPFRREFPLELFEVIIAHADTQSISRTARASLSCYELFMPVLLEHIQISEETGLARLFHAPPKAAPRSVQLSLLQAKHRVRDLTLSSSSLQWYHEGYSLDLARRIKSKSGCLELVTFTLLIDEHEVGHTCLHPHILPSSSERILQHFNPQTLTVRRAKPDAQEAESDDEYDEDSWSDTADHEQHGWTYTVSIDAATEISGWTRLEHVRLESIDLLTVPQHNNYNSRFLTTFLQPRKDVLVKPGELTFTWDLSAFPSMSDMENNAGDLLGVLLDRDDFLRQTWLRSFTVVFQTRDAGEEFQGLIEARREKRVVPSCLRWEVADATHQP